MIKILCLITLFLGVSYIGIAIGLNFSKKEKVINEVIMFCNVLSNNIKFNKNKIKTIINENINNYKTEFKNFLLSFLEDKDYDIDILTNFENEKIKEFFSSIGKMDSSSELNNIENYKAIFNEFYEKSKHKNNKYGNLYSKLGVIFGLILIIVFI